MNGLLCRMLMVSLALAAVSSCKHEYSIEGKVELYGYEGENLYLVTHENNEFIAMDSCSVRHGRFTMEGRADSAVFAVLCHGFEPVLPMFVERGRISVLIAPSNLNVSGTRLNELLYEFLKRKNEIDNHFEDLLQQTHNFANRVNGTASVYEDSLKTVVQEAEEHISDFISAHYDDPLGPCIFMMISGYPSPSEITPLIRRILDDAPDSFIRNRSVSGYISSVGYTR